jgi:L-asparagine transporter-like permease
MACGEMNSLAAVATAMAVLLFSSCNMLFSLLENRDKPEYLPSIRWHFFTTMFLVLAVVLLLVRLSFSGWTGNVIPWLLRLAAFAVVLTIPCACQLAFRLGVLRKNPRLSFDNGGKSACRCCDAQLSQTISGTKSPPGNQDG